MEQKAGNGRWHSFAGEDRKGTLAVAVPLQSCLPGPFSEDCWLGGGRDRVSGEEYTDDGSLLCVGLRDSHLDNSY